MAIMHRTMNRPVHASLHHSTMVAHGVYQVSLSIVNVFFIGEQGAASGDWVLVDTGMPFSAAKILKAADELYGSGSRPAAIILTHGHFDHTGTVKDLADEWQVPVYAHALEHPYLDGTSAYPPGDPAVGGGAMSLMSPFYPRGPIDLGRKLRTLPSSGRVPGARGWEWVHTPGHTPGHVSLYRPDDGVLIAGDAFVTTRQESMIGALLQPRELNGPPKYFTPDWESAWRSVVMLSRIPIRVAATGHGRPMSGDKLRYALMDLAEHFWTEAVPDHGRYVNSPAVADRSGVQYVPPRSFNPEHVAVLAIAAGIISVASIVAAIRR